MAFKCWYNPESYNYKGGSKEENNEKEGAEVTEEVCLMASKEEIEDDFWLGDSEVSNNMMDSMEGISCFEEGKSSIQIVDGKKLLSTGNGVFKGWTRRSKLVVLRNVLVVPVLAYKLLSLNSTVNNGCLMIQKKE